MGRVFKRIILIRTGVAVCHVCEGSEHRKEGGSWRRM